MKYVSVRLSELEVEELRLALDLIADIVEDAEYELSQAEEVDGGTE